MITRDGIQGMAAFSPPSSTTTKKESAKSQAEPGFNKELSQALGKPAATPATLRPDYKQKLEEALKSMLGPQTPPATAPAATKLTPVVTPLTKPASPTAVAPATETKASTTIDLDVLPPSMATKTTAPAKAADTKTIDLDKLPEKTLHELKTLQTAAEGFEAHFVKDWFSKMRQTSFDSDKSQTGAMAKDFMDQALAESVAKGSANLGVGKTVFVDTGKRLIQDYLAHKKFDTDTTA